MSSCNPEFGPQDFTEVVAAPTESITVAGREAMPILVGGQAVNLWA
jgi:hypothetical protein